MKRLLLFLLLSCPFFASSQPGSGSALDFNGSTSYCTAGTINLNGNQITLMGWINVDAFKTAFPNITSVMGTEQTNNSAFLRIGDAGLANNKLQFVLRINNNQAKLNGNASLQANRWYHVAATYDGSQMRIYIDGVQDASMTMSGSIASNALFELGRNYGNDRIIDGTMDELSVWNTALSQATIREWMCKEINNSHPNYANLLAYWQLNEGSGSTSTDASPNSNNATLVSSPLWVTSGAYIGDESVQSYSGAVGLSIAHPDGDSIEVVATSGTVTGIHLYRVDNQPNVTTAGLGLTGIDTSRYWGVYFVGSGTYTIRYAYGPNTNLINQSDCYLTMARRNDNSGTTWAGTTVTGLDIQADTLRFLRNASQEFIAGFNNSGSIHTIALTPTDVLCNGDSNGLVSSSVSGGDPPYLYAWSNASIDTTLSGLGAGTYTLTITDGSGCTTTSSVTVNEPPQLVVSASTLTENNCADDSIGVAQVAPSGGTNPYSIQWDDPAMYTTVTAINLPNGTYNVLVVDANGCSDSAQTSVTNLHPDPVPTLGNDTSICEGDMITISPTGTELPYTGFAWSDGSSLSFVTTGAGTYTVTVTNLNGCSGVTAPVTITTLPPPAPNLGPDINQQNPPATIDAGPGFASYAWSTGDTTQTITISMSGLYAVQVTDANGCTGVDTIEVTFSPIGIAEYQSPLIRLFPNPTSGQVTLEPVGEALGSVRVSVVDLAGRTVLVREMTSLSVATPIALNELANGTYYLRLETDDRQQVFPLMLSR